MTLVDLIFTAKTYRERARGSGLSRDVQFNAGQMVDFLDGVIAFLEQERPEASAPPQSRTLAIAQMAAVLYAATREYPEIALPALNWSVNAAQTILAEVEKRG